MPIRVGIHICVGAGKLLVNIQTSLLTLYTPTNIYKYPNIEKMAPIKGAVFHFTHFGKKHKAATFFFKKPFWVWKYI
jgi:hypothetical protein